MVKRQVVRAEFTAVSVFVVPEGIDLDNTEQVEEWYVKYNNLYIHMKDGREFEIIAYIDALSDDYKHPTKETIETEPVDDDYDEEYHTISARDEHVENMFKEYRK